MIICGTNTRLNEPRIDAITKRAAITPRITLQRKNRVFPKFEFSVFNVISPLDATLSNRRLRKNRVTATYCHLLLDVECHQIATEYNQKNFGLSLYKPEP